jgi:hypothetical protein
MADTSLTWGDTVRVSGSAPKSFRPNELGAVCGLWELDAPEKAQNFKEAAGTVMCLVEFGDGTGVEIPHYLLEKIE